MTHYLGFCDHCREARTFASAEERDAYETGHPHGRDDD